MAEITGHVSLTDEQRCKRSDGRGWRCRRLVADGKAYCETHIQQALLRQRRQPVPDHLKLERAKRSPIVPKSEQDSEDGVTDAPVSRRKRKMPETSEGVLDVPRKKARKVKKEDSAVGSSDQSEIGGPIVVDLTMGRMEIAPAKSSASAQRKEGSPTIKIGACSSAGLRRPIRSKNCEPVPTPAVKHLPSIRENIKAVAKKKTIKKCHWCRLSSFCSLVKCLTCKKNFFCEECINIRFYCKKTVERECPVCQGGCPCRACTRGKPKQVKTKEPVIHDLEEDVIIYDPENEVTVVNREKKSDFDTSQHLHMIRELLPLMTKMNQEKIIELDTEAKNKGICHDGVHVQITGYTQKKECSFCKACIPDVHRNCNHCSFSLCLVCCHDIRDGFLPSRLENLKNTKMVRSKSLKNKTWRFCLHGSIRCPPKNIGGCGGGFLRLSSFYPFSLTKDLEENAKRILCNFNFKKLDGLSNSSPCMLCDEDDETGLYFYTKQEFKNDNLKHFIRHWGKGQAIVIRDAFQSQPDLNWDCGFMLCEYLEKSAQSRKNTKMGHAKNTRDWCKIKFGREQIFLGGIAHGNAWIESLKFKLQFSLDFFQDHFVNHYNAVIHSLPVQEYMNPLVGFLNLGAFSPYQTKNPNLGSYVTISYGVSDNPLSAKLLSNLHVNAYDMVNILVHATSRPMSETALSDVKMLMNKYNSQDHLMSSKKIVKRNKLEEMFASSSRLDNTSHSDVDLTSSRLEDSPNHEVVLVPGESESESESKDEECSQDANTYGAQWDIFRREDAPKLIEYLRKYTDKLSGFRGSFTKVVHPLFDDVFYLDDVHIKKLKEEFDVDALSFKHDVGEAVIIPAGCPYQMRRIKSCVNVVFEFMSPESASDGIKVSDEVRLLPVNHKAKWNMVQVKEMVINRMHAAIEDIREVFVSQPE
ncbi:hypothetical protein R6Q59_001935 [Mikania micrantha]